MTILTGYFLSAGGLTAGLRVVRGAVRGAGRALAGDARGALAEAAGGLIAPAAQVSREARLLITSITVIAPGKSEVCFARRAIPFSGSSKTIRWHCKLPWLT